MDYTVNTDGGSRGNPGIAGAGAIIRDSSGNVVGTAAKYLGQQTNNWAEYEGVVLGLEKLKSLVGKDKVKETQVELKLDSELIAKQLRGEYQVKEETLFSQFIKVHNLRVAHFPNLTITHVAREQNTDADRLANEAMDSGGGESGLFN